MAFTFPDPNVTPEFTGPNAITYIWDSNDNKWVIKTTGSDALYVKKAGDTMTGDLLLQDNDGDPAEYTDATDPSTAVNKKYVDEQDEILQQEIIELEEEIDAIAPSLQRGEWEFDMSKTNPDPGYYYLIADVDGNAALTDQYNQANAAVFHNVDGDLRATTHAWDTVEVGQLIQIFDKPDPDYVLGEITDVDTAVVPNAVRIKFTFVSGQGSPDNNPDIKTSRLNIFEAPSGGTADEFVRKRGDKMSGVLEMVNKEEDGTTYALSESTSHLTFSTKNSSGSERSVSIYQPGYGNRLEISSELDVHGNVGSSTGRFFGYSITNSDKTLTNYAPRLYFKSDDGGFYYGGWNDEQRRVWFNSGYNYLSHGGKNFARWNTSGINLYYQNTARIEVNSNGTQFYNPVFLDKDSSRIRLKSSKTASDNNQSSVGYGNAGQVLTSNGSSRAPYWSNPGNSAVMKSGTDTSPNLSRGEMYWNYSNFTIYVGK